DAINEIRKTNYPKDTAVYLYVKEGDYFGVNNKGLDIDFNLNIISTKGSSKTIIDCQKSGYAFRFSGSVDTSISINGFTIRRCASSKGAAIHVSNYDATIEDLVFFENRAREGSAIYVADSTRLLMIDDCAFHHNTGSAALYLTNIENVDIRSTDFNSNDNDVVCGGNTFITSADGSFFGSTCNDQCQIVDEIEYDDLCGQTRFFSPVNCDFDGQCQSTENSQSCPSDCPFNQFPCNNNGLCDSNENFDTCPKDCSRQDHPGWKLDVYDVLLDKPMLSSASGDNRDSNLYSSEFLAFSEFTNFKSRMPVFSARMTTYVTVVQGGYYFFKLETNNIDAIIFVNGRVLFDTYRQGIQEKFVNQRKLLLSQGDKTFIEIVFYATSTIQRDLSLEWRNEKEQLYKSITGQYSLTKDQFYCGDGVCNEVHPESCLIDCYSLIEEICPGQSPPAKLQDYYQNTNQDLVGTLLNNQYILSLPGINYMSHGIDIRTGVPNASPIFDLTYCDNTSFSIVQNPYRGLVYSVPQGLFAQISPKCTTDSKTKTFSTARQMAQEEAIEKEFGFQVPPILLWKVLVSGAYSESESTNTASEMEKRNSGTVSKSTIMCESTKVHLVKEKLHPKFIADIAKTFVKDLQGVYNQDASDENLKQLIIKYGSLYHRSAILGGKLEIISTVKSSYSRKKTENEISNARDVTVNAQASGGILTGTATVTDSLDSTTKEVDQSEYESNSERSSVKVYGGKSGSYGLDEPNAFASWAQTVDLVPYPIDYKVGMVADVIPEYWFFQGEYNVKEAWERCEMNLYSEYFKSRQYKYIDFGVKVGRDQTMYNVQGIVIAVEFKLTIVDSKGVSHVFENVPAFDSKNNMILSYNDNNGIRSLKFEHSSSTIPLPDNIEIYNIFSSRFYSLKKDVGSNLMVTQSSTPDLLVLDFKAVHYEALQDDLHCDIQIKIIGTLNHYTETQPISIFSRYVPQDYTWTILADNFLGKIIGIEFSFFRQSDSSRFSVFFDSLLLRQSCPIEEISSCLPLGTVFDEIGYTKAYERWRDQTILTNNQQETDPVYISIELLGN
ncbi:hypothetical protein CYY_009274, partial [Polysphondylium violaceum]